VKGLSIMEMEWAILMADPDRRAEIESEERTERDSEAVLLSEKMRIHISRG
jgi:hypothetical protein